MRIALLTLLLIAFCPVIGIGQSDMKDSATITVNDRTLHFINKKYDKLNASIDRKVVTLLHAMQCKEEKLKKRMDGADTVKAKELFSGAQATYDSLKAVAKTPSLNNNRSPEFIPGLDSIQTAFKYLQQKALQLPGSIPTDKLQKITAISGSLQELQSRLDQANQVAQFVREREQLLKSQLLQYGFAKDLLGMNKQVFYYRQQLEEYKHIINDKQKLEELVLARLSELPAFQEFMKNNSYVGRLFSLPANFSDPASLAGLQTRDQVAQMISQRVGSTITPSGSSDPARYFQPQIDQAQGQLNALKNKLQQYGGSSSTIEQPDFKPNGQKTKTFLKRITYGFNIQNQQQTNLIPSISNLAFTAGYRLTDKSIIGIGGNYLLGLGNGINHLKLTNQGAGIRSYIDIKAKGNFWLSGGLEWNYMQSFAKFSDLKNVDVWQPSALFGLTKKYKLSKTKESNMQLLYDALHNQHTPHSQPLIFRLGYSIN